METIHEGSWGSLGDGCADSQAVHRLDIVFKTLVHHPVLLHHRHSLELGRLNEDLIHAATPSCSQKSDQWGGLGEYKRRLDNGGTHRPEMSLTSSEVGCSSLVSFSANRSSPSLEVSATGGDE